MEPVPVVRKSSNTWVWWVVAAVAIILLMLWMFGAFNTGTGTTMGQPGTPGADMRPMVEDMVQAVVRFG